MHAPLEMVSAPTPGTSAKWWPDLYLKLRGTLQKVTPEQCGAIREIYNNGRGADEIPRDLYLYDVTGAKIGFVGYNGRTWLNDIENRVEIPQRGFKTAKEQNADSWKDCK